MPQLGARILALNGQNRLGIVDSFVVLILDENCVPSSGIAKRLKRILWFLVDSRMELAREQASS